MIVDPDIYLSFSSLKSKDVSLVISACEFLSDVVFRDFPAEVFLQRPFIIKVLYHIYVGHKCLLFCLINIKFV